MCRFKFLILLQLIACLSTNADTNISAQSSVIDQKITVEAGQRRYYDFAISEGSSLKVNFDVDGSFDKKAQFLMLDLANFERYISDEPYFPIKDSTQIERGSNTFSLTAPSSNLYYLVIDNSKSLVKLHRIRTRVEIEERTHG